MSNAKKVLIKGELNVMAVTDLSAFSGADDQMAQMMAQYQNIKVVEEPEDLDAAISAAKDIVRFMAMTVVPYFGLKFTFSGKERTEKNSAGGRVAYLDYVISGEEAISYSALEGLVKNLGVLGKVFVNTASDVDYDG